MDNEPRTVTAVGISVNTAAGAEVNARLEAAMSQAVLNCNAEGISTCEENSAVIKARIQTAFDNELAAIAAGG